MSSTRFFQLVAASVVWSAAVFLAPTPAAAAPGTCKCNNGCHANPAQCVKAAGCNIGYAPSCGFRTGDGGIPECPKTDYISCNGDCTCVPIPGFCETVGGAEYCDAGPEPTPDTGPGDTGPADTGAPLDSGVAPDSSTPDTTVVDSSVPDTTATDSGTPDTTTPDTIVPDSVVPDSAAVDSAPDGATDTFVPDSCVPLACPPGTKSVPIPGECDPYCAPPCGSGEFKCPGLTGASCTDGFCVPKCLVSPCPDCKRCSLGDGTCFDDPTACDGGVGDGGGDGASDGASDGAVGDTGLGPDGSVGDVGADGSLDDGGAEGGLADPDAVIGGNGGCGCSTPQTGNAGLAGLALPLAWIALRRRKGRGPRSAE